MAYTRKKSYPLEKSKKKSNKPYYIFVFVMDFLSNLKLYSEFPLISSRGKSLSGNQHVLSPYVVPSIFWLYGRTEVEFSGTSIKGMRQKAITVIVLLKARQLPLYLIGCKFFDK
jgi:hypothetical protein